MKLFYEQLIELFLKSEEIWKFSEKVKFQKF